MSASTDSRRAMTSGAAADVVDALNLALLLAYLQSDLYSRAAAVTGFIPAADATVFATLKTHESQHAVRLTGLIIARGRTPIALPVFDFTAKGAIAGFAFVPAQYETFRKLAQAFEDLSVRAYKGQMQTLATDKGALTAALAIHAVEARHAAEVRRLRGLKPWITASSADDLPAFAQAIYAGEGVTTQGSVDVSAALASTGGADAASQAFDEPLSAAQVTAIVTPFIV